MIKIHDKLWYVIKPDQEDNLAYMCQAEFTKEGEASASLKKMQGTGRSWARISAQTVYKKKEGSTSWDYELDEQGRLIIDHTIPAKEGSEQTVANTPTQGFYIGDSVSRWSTDNKLFRVKDPRGFTVEVPTGNIATLLHHTTVVNGVVQEECVWGREGNSHILLPVNSQPYLDTLDKMDTLANKLIPIKDLKVGDWVKMFNDDTEYYYAGKIKATWKVRGVIQDRSYYYHSERRQDTYSEYVEVKDDKWVDVFLHKYSWSKDIDKWNVDHPSKPKIVEIVKNDPMVVTPDILSMYCPERVYNRTGLNEGQYNHLQAELVDIEFKGEK